MLIVIVRIYIPIITILFKSILRAPFYIHKIKHEI
jgi:hypothetical protein